MITKYTFLCMKITPLNCKNHKTGFPISINNLLLGRELVVEVKRQTALAQLCNKEVQISGQPYIQIGGIQLPPLGKGFPQV